MLYFCPMPDAYSSFDDIICASFNATSLLLCLMPYAHSSLNYLISAAFYSTSFDLCPMFYVNSSIDDFVCSSSSAAQYLSKFRTMLDAYSSILSLTFASIDTA
mmetsp:Transcript_33490/g.50331  ORF Transcript_33490/g.50331 Transcript_33490/m.50331 type:complete len:103 (-) Transcript_33490:732-1040(-)